MELPLRPDRFLADPAGARLDPSAPLCGRMKTPSDESLSGTALTRSLPHPNTKRWVVRRKAAVVAAVRSGAITIEEACRVYQLSEEELLSWQHAFEIHGLAGLRATRIQQYRASRSARGPSASLKEPVEAKLLRHATPSEVS
jgi:Protein of unknown function (DUF1153)